MSQQYSINIDLMALQRWGINIQQGVVFAYIYNCPSWCNRDKDDPDYFNISNGKIASDMPSVTEKRDTMLRHILKLVEAGVLERKTVKKRQYLKLTDKGKTWNRKQENNPASIEEREKNPEGTGNLSRKEREIFPTNQFINTSVQEKSVKEREKPAKTIPPDYAKMVVQSFHDSLPELQSVKLWDKTQARYKHLLKIYNRTDIQTNDPQFWESYFDYVRTNDWWMGRTSDKTGKPFKATFEFLIHPHQFVRIVEGCLSEEAA